MHIMKNNYREQTREQTKTQRSGKIDDDEWSDFNVVLSTYFS